MCNKKWQTKLHTPNRRSKISKSHIKQNLFLPSFYMYKIKKNEKFLIFFSQVLSLLPWGFIFSILLRQTCVVGWPSIKGRHMYCQALQRGFITNYKWNKNIWLIFKVYGIPMRKGKGCIMKLHCEYHNHELKNSLVGHPYVH